MVQGVSMDIGLLIKFHKNNKQVIPVKKRRYIIKQFDKNQNLINTFYDTKSVSVVLNIDHSMLCKLFKRNNNEINADGYTWIRIN